MKLFERVRGVLSRKPDLNKVERQAQEIKNARQKKRWKTDQVT